MNSRWRSESGGEINLAPLLDVIFTLLFFFVVATSIREERRVVDVELPRTGRETARVTDAKALEVQVTEQNRIVFGGLTYEILYVEPFQDIDSQYTKEVLAAIVR